MAVRSDPPPAAKAVRALTSPADDVAPDEATDGSRTAWNFRSDIEGLRAVAILLVIAYHARLPWAQGGFIGVDVFFVLSGFLITGILVAEIRRTGRISLTRFWARRARRLLPAAAVVTVVTVAASAVLSSPYELLATAKTSIAFAAYVSNLRFVRQEADYFADAVATDPLLHTWSLSVEEQFYLAYAPLVALIAWSVAARDRGRMRDRMTKFIGALTILSLLACLIVVRRWPVEAFYTLPTRAWEFGAGALLAIGGSWSARLSAVPLEAVALLALGGLIASAVVIGEGTAHPGPATIVPVLCTMVLIATGASTRVGRMLSMGPMRLIGRLSYSWYLWHWAPLVLLPVVLGFLTPWERLLIALATLVPSALTYAFVEQPIRESRWLAARPRFSLGGAFGLSITTAAVALLAWWGGTRVIASPRFAFIREAQAQPTLYDDGCHAEPNDVDIDPCIYGVADADTTIVLFGDSHAAHWFPAVEHVARTRGWRLVPFTKSGCPSATVTVSSHNLRRRYDECDAWRAGVLEWIARERPAVVVISNRQTYRIDSNGHVGWLRTDADARSSWKTGLHQTIAAVHGSGGRVIVLQDSPLPPNDPMICLERAYREPDRCALSRSLAIDTVMVAIERSVAGSVPDASYISLASEFCGTQTCPVVMHGVAVYRDDHHLTVSFAERLGPVLDSALRVARSSAGVPHAVQSAGTLDPAAPRRIGSGQQP